MKDEARKKVAPETPEQLAAQQEVTAETLKNEGKDPYAKTLENMGQKVTTGLLTRLKPVHCPLCKNEMHIIKDPISQVYAWACELDRVAINVLDPLVDKWELRVTEKIECLNPQCSNTPMRLFFTSTGFMKAVCPKCGASISNSNVDRKTCGPTLKRDGWSA